MTVLSRLRRPPEPRLPVGFDKARMPMTVHERPEGSARGWSAKDRVPPLDYDLAPAATLALTGCGGSAQHSTGGSAPPVGPVCPTRRRLSHYQRARSGPIPHGRSHDQIRRDRPSAKSPCS